MRRGIRSIIDSSSLEIEVVGESEDGLIALDIIEKTRPDILLVDIRMPGIDGLTFISEASKILENSKYIIISGYDDFNYAKRAISLNVIEYILKPIDRDSLINSINKAISILEGEKNKKSEVIRMERFFDESSVLVKEKLITEIIEQGNDSIKVENVSKIFGFDLDSYCFACISVKVQNLQEIIKEKGQIELSLINFTLKNIIHELVSDQYRFFVFLNKSGILNIILFNNKFKPNRNRSNQG